VKYALAKFPRLLFTLLLATSSFASQEPFVRVRWKGSELRITYKNKLMTYDYGDAEDSPELFLYTIDKVKTDFLAEEDDVVYMILNVEGPSRGPEGADSQCGAGMEAAKILFAFDRKGEVKGPEIALYESCYHNLERDPDMDGLTDNGKEHRFAVAKFSTALAGPQYHVVTKSITKWFDPESPKQGFTTTESCTDLDPASQSARYEPITCPQ
jgi:hypothetical protein